MLRERNSEFSSQVDSGFHSRSNNIRRKARYNLSDIVLDMNKSPTNDFDISTDSFKYEQESGNIVSDSEDDEHYKNAQIIDFVISDNEDETNDLNIFTAASKRESIKSALQENLNISNVIVSNINEKRIPLSPSSNNISLHRHSSSLSQIVHSKRQSIHSNSSKRFSILSFTNSSLTEDKENRRLSTASSSSSKKRFSTASIQSVVSSSNSNTNTSAGSITSAKNNITRAVRKRFSSINVVDDDDIKTLKPQQSISNFRAAEPLQPVVYSDQASIVSTTPSLRSQRSIFRLSSLFHKKEANADDSESVRSVRGRNSLSDLRKSMLSFSPSTNNLLRSLNRKDSIDRNMISLPKISNTETKENLKNKLRTSSSIISINSVISSQTQKPSSINSYNFHCLQTLLSLTNFNSVLKFHEVFNNAKYDKLIKFADSPLSEIYKLNNDFVYKIIPFSYDSTSDVANVEDTIQELKNLLTLKNTPGFVKIERSMVVKGEYPEKLKSLYSSYSLKAKPKAKLQTTFDEEQLYLIAEIEFGGIDLAHFLIQSWEIACDIFWKVVKILNEAETKFKFEHRDLHWGNILIDPRLNVKLIDFDSSRLQYKEDEIISTRLDSQEFFKGKGDYQFEIYRLMRNEFSSANTNNDTTIDWSRSVMKTNLFWLHYLLDKLINHKKIKAKDTAYRNELIRLFKTLTPSHLEANELRSCGDLLKFAENNGLI